MTRSDVRKIAWTLRLLGLGMLGGAFALMLVGAGRVPHPESSAPIARLQAVAAPTGGVTR